MTASGQIIRILRSYGWGAKLLRLALQELQFDPARRGFDVIISGHSHRPRIETMDRILYRNSGSAGPRRFKLPVTLATLGLSFTSLVAPTDRKKGATQFSGACRTPAHSSC